MWVGDWVSHALVATETVVTKLGVVCEVRTFTPCSPWQPLLLSCLSVTIQPWQTQILQFRQNVFTVRYGLTLKKQLNTEYIIQHSTTRWQHSHTWNKCKCCYKNKEMSNKTDSGAVSEYYGNQSLVGHGLVTLQYVKSHTIISYVHKDINKLWVIDKSQTSNTFHKVLFLKFTWPVSKHN